MNLMILYSELCTLIKIFKKGWYNFLFIYLFGGILRFFYKRPLGNIKSNIQNHTLYIPIFQPINRMLAETFIYENLSFIEGYNTVLDLGGFVGETALYLGQRNKKVEVYEMDIKNYQYLRKNCKDNINIKTHQIAVSIKNGLMKVNKTIMFDPSGSIGNIGDADIKTIDILEILSKPFEAIKIDIEGAEFDVVSRIIDNNHFNFLCGFIEYHFVGDDRQKKKAIFDEHVKYLLLQGYKIWYIDNKSSVISPTISKDTYISLCFKK